MTDDSSNGAAHTASINLEPNDSGRLARLCGPFDQHLKHLEGRLGIRIRSRNNDFQISGPRERVRLGRALLSRLYEETNKRDALDADLIHLFLQEAGMEELADAAGASALAGGNDGTGGEDQQGGDGAEADERIVRTRKKAIEPRGANQRGYVASIRSHDVNFGIGPAGTGKTYLAVACAVEALESGRVNRILLVRPAVEAGERLGYLPGDLAQKIDPYLRPLYDALYEMLGSERVAKYIDRNAIELAPLAFMRGRTLNRSFIILDEGQNTTVEQMKMFLTRIGFGSTAVITGDITQTDLPGGSRSGLIHALEVLRNVPGMSFTHFNARDVVRHEIVQRIIEAYASDEHAAKTAARNGAGRKEPGGGEHGTEGAQARERTREGQNHDAD